MGLYLPPLKVECVDVLIGLGGLPSGSIDCVVTSPPYNIGIKYGAHDDNMSDYLPWIGEVWREVFRVLAADGHFFLQVGGTAKHPRIPQEVLERALATGFVLQNEIIWVKSVAIDGKTYGHFKPINSRRFVNCTHEYIFHLTKTGEVPVDRLAVGVPFVYESNIKRFKANRGRDLRCRGSIWHIPYKTIQSKAERGHHPAVFPVELPEMCIGLSGIPAGSLVLDPFIGTGSTLIACKRLGMAGIGFDIDPAYVKSACAWLESTQG